MARTWIGRGAARGLWIVVLALWLPAAADAQTKAPYQLEKLASESHKAGKDREALAAAERRVRLVEQHKEARGALASALVGAAWYALFARQPEKALVASERALKFAPHNLVIETNHAHALLFLGRTEEARAIYVGHKGERIGKSKWEAAIAQDFKEFRARGLGHPAMAAVEKSLATLPDSALAQSTAELHALIDHIGKLREKRKYAEAIPLAEKLRATCERVLGKEHPVTLASVSNLAMLHYQQGQYAKAEPLFRRVLKIRKRVQGEEHPDTLMSVNDLAGLYSGQGRYAEAEPLFRRALEARERMQGEEHPDTLTSVNNLAGLYKAQGRYGEAEPLYQRALEASERVLGKEHPDTLMSVNNLATLYEDQGRYAEAEPLYHRALETSKRVLGEVHPLTITSVNNLAGLYSHQGRYADAEPLYRRALEAFERVKGKEHPDTLTSVNNLATLYEDQGRYADAEPLYRRALETSKRVLGSDHPLTLTGVNNLAGLYQAQGRYAEAETLYRRVIESLDRVLGKEHPKTLGSVNNLAVLCSDQGRYAEAELLHRRALEARERVLGKEHPKTLASVNNLAVLYRAQGRYGEAESLFRRAFKTFKRVLGDEHPDTLLSVNNLAELYRTQGRYGEAEPLYRRALAVSERVLGKDHPMTLTSVGNLAMLLSAQGRYSEAKLLLRGTLEARERVLGDEHPDTLLSVNNLAELYRAQGRYGNAEPLYRRALAVSERVLGRDHPLTLTSVGNLATLCHNRGRYGEAERLYRRALEASERVLGKEHPDTFLVVNNLGMLFQAQERYREAESLFRRVLAGFERVYGKDHPLTLTGANNLAALYDNQGRYAEAEPLYRRTLETRERVLGKEHPDTLRSVNNLGFVYQAQGRYGEAEPLFRRARETQERVLGGDHPLTLTTVNNLAVLHTVQGRYAEAKPLYRRALKTRERALGKTHPDTLMSINNLASLYFVQHDWSRAVGLWRRSTAAITERTLRSAAGTSVAGKKKSEAERGIALFRWLVRAGYRLAAENGGREALSREMFQTAQWAITSEAAQSLAQMAARGASGNPKLEVIVRERQDLVGQWQKLDAWRNAALGQDAGKRDAKAEAENTSQLTAIDTRIAEIGKRLAAEFPDYAALANAAPLTVEEVQAQLGAGEALVLFFDMPEPTIKSTPEETFIWVVTKTGVRWERSDLGTKALSREVQALRCGLDRTAWSEPHCAKLTGTTYDYMNSRSAPPFDRARAHALYTALFGQVEDFINGKHLLIVPSGPLTQLPFQVLVTAPPAGGGLKSAVWLARNHAVTILPAVSSLKALRRTARPSTAAKPMIGFGNPLLDGQQNHPNPRFAEYFKKRAQLARDSQHCPKTAFRRAAALLGWRGGVKTVESRGGLAQVSQIRVQTPLPETADELCAVARDLKADVGELRLGARATEHEVKALSASGQLAQYRIVHFATHGALAGELRGTSEPGLILTPPATASGDDDGYLSAGEIAGLRLDADWVILSACNTAAGGSADAQALSGLARAFIYAQARALLVSHWSVDSATTVKLISTAMREMSRDSNTGRAEAVRRAMLALIDKGEAKEAHPAYWAPFVVVGEGAW